MEGQHRNKTGVDLRVQRRSNTKSYHLITILKEMGTDLDPYSMSDSDLLDEIIRRIHLSKMEKTRTRRKLSKLIKENESLRQLDINDFVTSLDGVRSTTNEEKNSEE